MIVFDLRCGFDHVFEAWFASGAAYDEQAAAGLLACPMCGDTAVAKAVMAPSMPAKGNRRADLPPAAALKAALRDIAAGQARALVEDGVPVAPLLCPVVPPEKAH